MHRLRSLPRNRAGQFQAQRRRRALLRLQAGRESRGRGALQGSDGRLPGRSDRQRRRVNELTPVALTIAGSDSSAGAGIQADLKTFAALGAYGVNAVTCVVAETPGKVSRLEPVSAEIVREQIVVIAKNFPISAIKTGLLCSAEIISAVAKAIVDLTKKIPLVVDPVITATGGDPLLEKGSIDAYESKLFPIASLITPNLD